MCESVVVRIGDGDVLEKREVDSVVWEGESGEFDGGDGDLRVFGFEDEEVDSGDCCSNEDEEETGD